CAGLELLNVTDACDVIIIGRGGGSIEDLWAFNNEGVVRAVANSKIPVISAVGHETDFTLCDFVADLRAPTPSAAAELAVPDREEMQIRLDELFGRVEISANKVINLKREKFANIANKLELLSPSGRLAVEKKDLAQKYASLEQNMERIIQKKRESLSVVSAKLAAINPLAVLSRGYSYSQKDGVVVSSVSALEIGDKLDIKFADGSVSAEIISIN
ncbi:MAG: exodeoxyribonuclease VII large subunit, partial [Ruminococcaceae bacterium]|nr:exodeoxyribonuclease VII large subunit [Oscillospiraceae bacterium]